MKKNLYYRDVIRRENYLKILFFNIFGLFASPARLLLEVFIRKNFGERYFKLSNAIFLAAFLAFIPLLYIGAIAAIANMPGGAGKNAPSPLTFFLLHYLTWYVFLAGFIYFSIKHYKDKQRNPSVFDFAKYSLYSGKFHPLFLNIQIGGKSPDRRTLECFLEPAFFFCVGFMLTILTQAIGPVLIICSILYSISYMAAYDGGDNFVMDKIDEIILNEGFEKAFIDGADEDEARGFRFMGRLPNDPSMRARLLPLIEVEENEEEFAVR